MRCGRRCESEGCQTGPGTDKNSTESDPPLHAAPGASGEIHQTLNASELSGESKHGAEAPDDDVLLIYSANKTKPLSRLHPPLYTRDRERKLLPTCVCPQFFDAR
ncbi:hypothetical protein ILYODFUR_034494 [Ilyodon furcidens]|uniref:Uncharacterized protein n=1 Tax=Ilyodon furcidens TaxID=33524 RepID=A0ABV0TQY9_9TELE